MEISRGWTSTWSVGCLALLALARPAAAAELYVSGNLGVSADTGDAGGTNTLMGSPNSGSDIDSSTVFGAAMGVQMPLDQIVPWSWDWDLPGWNLRTELEGSGGRDAELQTEAPSGLTYQSNVQSWSVMVGTWLDIPLHAPISHLFGRVPLLEPLSLYLGGGLGMASSDVKTDDGFSSGSDTAYNFAYEAGTGLGYELTEHVTFGFGYRYLSLGQVDVDLAANGLDTGNLTLDLAAHEFLSRIRVSFYSLPFGR